MPNLINQPLLSPAQIMECIQLGHHWAGNGFYWSMRETRDGHSGQFSSQQQGSGIDFSETRPYQPGDELRHMNWRATARTGRPQVRVFQQEQTPVSYFLVDRRSTMRFGTRQRLKVTQAVRMAIFLASWEAQSGAELGGFILNESLQLIAPTSGQTGVFQLAEMLNKPCPPLFDVSCLGLKKTLALLVQQLPPGSHLYVLSDFIDLDETCMPRLFQLGEQHRVWFLHIHDRAEQQLPHAGHLQLVWDKLMAAESSAVNTADINIQQQHQQRFLQRQQAIKEFCNRAGVFFSSVSSEENDVAKALQPERF